jgi:predicted DCC family thiol-disulfide oxidoreductase YuxK
MTQTKLSPQYHVIYDGDCNLCATFTQLLMQFDQGNIFDYIPMQDSETLASLAVTSTDCELGMILIKKDDLSQRWQGSEAAEKIVELLPLGAAFLRAYRGLPGVKSLGDRLYIQIRDHRYQWFGRRKQTYHSPIAFGCQQKQCNS